MERFRRYLKGDISLWGVILFFALLSFLPVYSSSSNLVYLERTGISTRGYLIRHVGLIAAGLLIIYLIHRFPYRYFRPLARLGLLLSWILLFFALLKGSTIEGANASRWIYIMGISFQPSAFAMIILLMYVASYLAEVYETKYSFAESILPLWLPVGITLAMVTLPNLSTGAMMYAMVLMVLYIGRYPIKYILGSSILAVLLFALFMLVVKAFPDAFPHRVDTWKNRIETFMSKDKEENYQSERQDGDCLGWILGARRRKERDEEPPATGFVGFYLCYSGRGIWTIGGLCPDTAIYHYAGALCGHLDESHHYFW